ncbi:hypothetical protein [Brucella anthropi]|uniref:hypothetical protein n=1 Tax=Brucella anthropi TaxID=529 RepID=UPI001F3062C6|nr:hypothetical protein [Brucella anthropi]
MQEGRRFFRFGQEQRQFLLALFQPHHLCVDRVGCAALEDQVEQCVEFPVDPCDLGFG